MSDPGAGRSDPAAGRSDPAAGRSDPIAYEHALARELRRVGIAGRVHRRILDEIADHLACDPEASLGDPRGLARQFADVVGTARAKTASLAAFASLVVAGLLFVGSFLAGPSRLLGSGRAAGASAPLFASSPVAGWAAGVAVMAGQVALAAGCLAALRWLWRRQDGILPAAEATVIVRRAAVGVAAGIVTMVCLGVIGLADRPQIGPRGDDAVLAVTAIGLVGLVAAVPWIWGAARVRPVAPGPAGDILADLGPLAPASLRGRPWRVACLLAAGIVMIATLAGLPATDVLDGAVRGLADAGACLIGFALLGPYLGLWGSRQQIQPQ